MDLQKYLPYEHYTLISKLSFNDVFKRLSDNIDHKTAVVSSKFVTYNMKPYKGNINVNTFEISRVIDYRNAFLPLITGQLSPNGNGTKIVIKMKPTTFVIIFISFWMGTVGLVCLGGILVLLLQLKNVLLHGFPPMILIPYVMFVFGYFLCTLSFKYESKISKEFISKLLESEEKAI